MGSGPGRDRGLLDHAFDLESLEVRGVLVEGLLDGQLERRLGRGAAAAAPLEPEMGDPVDQREELDVAAVRLHVWPDAVERLDDPVLEADRVEVVDQQQAADRPVGGELVADGDAGRSSLLQRRHDPLESVSVELHHRGDHLLSELTSVDVGQSLDLLVQELHTAGEFLAGRGLLIPSQHRPVGVCWTFLTLPLPRYMCVPQGRHGSKLRTARMMSMPLKFSGPFSSKIGVFCTASS